ncbi:MAG: Transcriptional regulator, MerR family, partial [uncultured Quadrisphaera sp.]
GHGSRDDAGRRGPRAHGRPARRRGRADRAQRAGVLRPRAAPTPAHGRPHRLLRPRARGPAAAGARDARRGLHAGDDRADAHRCAADRELGHPRPAPRPARAVVAARARAHHRAGARGPRGRAGGPRRRRQPGGSRPGRAGRRHAPPGARPGAAHRGHPGAGPGRAGARAGRRADAGHRARAGDRPHLRADVRRH